MIKSYRNRLKGFTLIELLAVIVILAIIALIITPVITDIIKGAREKAAEESAASYVSSANNTAAVSLVDSTKGISITNDKYTFVTGEDDDILDKVEISGDTPSYISLTFDPVNKVVTEGEFCINKYSIYYNNGNTGISTNDYCKYASVNSVSINTPSTTEVMKGDTLQLSATVDPSDITPTWSSSDTSIASVDSNGLVTGIAEGIVTIKARVGSKKSTVELTVLKPYAVYTDGTPVYFNVSTGKTCLSTEAVSTTNTETGCMKFYTFGDKGNKSSNINMILDHNTTANNALWAASVNTAGPTKTSGYAYYQLLRDTSSWVGVEMQSNYTYTNSSTSYTVKYGDDNAKARFITANEIATITGNTSWNSSTATSNYYFDSNSSTQIAASKGASKYAWLYDYTYQGTSYGCSISDDATFYSGGTIVGYWTRDAVAIGSYHVW